MYSFNQILARIAFLVASTTVANAVHVGKATWFTPGITACGTPSTSDFVVAVPPSVWTSLIPSATGTVPPSAVCGQKIRVADPDNLQSVVVTVEDECLGCGADNIALSAAAFRTLAPLTVAVINVTWEFV